MKNSIMNSIFVNCFKIISIYCLFPAGLIVNARGLAIITVAKLGFLVTARGGSGIVIAKVRGGGKKAYAAS